MFARYRFVVIAVFALAAPFVLLALLVKSPGSKPLAKPADRWNSNAITSAFAGVQVREIGAANSAVAFLYDLSNNSDNDYQLKKGPGVFVMGRLKSSGSLSSEIQIGLSASAFVPARKTTRVALEIAHPFAWPSQMDPAAETRFRQLVASDMADLNGFVLFDQANRYQIDLRLWPQTEQASNGTEVQ